MTQRVQNLMTPDVGVLWEGRVSVFGLRKKEDLSN
jgi:hypothetical protein